MMIDVPKVVLAGLLGSLAMSVVGLFPRLAGLLAVDMGHIVATKIFRIHTERHTSLGTSLHFLVGTLLAVVYAIAFHPLIAIAPGLRGAAFGLSIWLIVMLVVMPLLGEGLFGRRSGLWLAPVTLIMHLVYGSIVGGVYR